MNDREPVRLMILDTSPVNAGGAQLLFHYCAMFDPARVRPTMVLHEDNPWVERYRRAGTADVLVERGLLQSGTVTPIHQQSLTSFVPQLLGAVGRMAPAVLRLAGEIRRRRIDVLMGLSDTPAALAAVLGTLTGRPTIMHPVSTYVNRFEPAALTALGMLPAVRRVVQLSRYSASQFPRLLHKTVTVYSGIDYAELQRPLPPALRGRYGIPADTPLVGIAGRFYDVKGMDVFVRAAARIAAREPAARFFMLGDDRGAYGDSIHALVRELGLADRVVFTGFVDDMHAALAELDVVVVPSRRECAPLVIFESMALGKPVVASDVHGIPELVDRGRTGLLVPVDDDAAVAAAVLELLADPARRRRMGEAARERVRERFDARRGARRVQEVIVEAASESVLPWVRPRRSRRPA
ncbi:MAG: glycosyltransferase [Deltaproteobacteria bacterium]|nr:glycosyltransferase [Deltaproteobacteria bacterium]